MVRGALSLSFEAPARPLVGPYYVLAYQVVGDRPLLQALVLAALNAAVVLLFWRALRQVVGARTALLGTLLLAVVPNRGATRMWFVLGPNLVAVGLVALGAIVLLSRGRKAVAAVLFFTAILAYEGVAGVAVAVVLGWWLADRRSRSRPAAIALAPVLLAIAVAWQVSPKRTGGSPGPLANLGTIFHGQLGSGFWGNDVVGVAGMLVTVAAVTWCIVATFFPSFRRPQSLLRHEVAIGACLLVLGAAPFIMGGAPFAVRGIFDRNNLVPDLGSCLVVAALLAAAGRKWPQMGTALTAVVVAVLAMGNVQDVRDYRQAVRQGEALVEAVLADVDPDAGTVVVRPPLPSGTGVAAFILDSDLTAALVLRHGREWRSVAMPLAASHCVELVRNARRSGRPAFHYDRVARTVLPLDDPSECNPP